MLGDMWYALTCDICSYRYLTSTAPLLQLPALPPPATAASSDSVALTIHAGGADKQSSAEAGTAAADAEDSAGADGNGASACAADNAVPVMVYGAMLVYWLMCGLNAVARALASFVQNCCMIVCRCPA